jgi:hypothetical protein
MIGVAGVRARAVTVAVAEVATERAGPDWEERCYGAGCAFARELATGMLTALDAWLHVTRPAGYRVEGWRTRVLVTRMGDLRVRRRLYRNGTGHRHFLLDAHLGWLPRHAAPPSVLALLVDWATDMPFTDVATKLAAATAGVLSGPTVRRHLRRVAERVRAAEVATHHQWTTTGQVPGPAGERVVSPLYVEAALPTKSLQPTNATRLTPGERVPFDAPMVVKECSPAPWGRGGDGVGACASRVRRPARRCSRRPVRTIWRERARVGGRARGRCSA